jgi:type I restriction enzyme S subunit
VSSALVARKVKKYGVLGARPVAVKPRFVEATLVHEPTEAELARREKRDYEPASELLKRIREEKARLILEGQIKRQEALPPAAVDELPFAVPTGWVATRLASVAVCLDYLREPVNGTERQRRIAGKDPSELFPYFGATQQQGWIDDYIFDEELVLLGEDGVPFFDGLRPKAYLVSGRTWVNNHAHVFRGILVSHGFLAHYLNTFDYSGRVAGATRSKLNQAKAIDIPVILPPLAEQHRIVAKADALMALCDRLEGAQAKRESRRDRLVAASLNRLNQPADAGDTRTFRDHACFHFRHFPRLATDRKSVV